MSKRIHPIRNLVNVLNVECMHWMSEDDLRKRERLVAKHVKPLLDALADNHLCTSADGPVCITGNADMCSDCRLLAAWKVKP